MLDSVKRKITEAYHNLENSGLDDLYEYEELTNMCESCEHWMGEAHDYTECKGRPCFTNWLAMYYLDWYTGWEEYGGY